jgi:hypothetical protein
MLGARGDCRRENHERDLSHRRTDHGVAGGGLAGAIGGDCGAAFAGGDPPQSSVLVEAIKTP